MVVLNKNSQIQPKWPLRIDKSVGPYTSVFGTGDSLKQDFVILLQTIPGEWPMNPDLGVGLVRYLFETNGSIQMSKIKSKIENQLNKYLPSIKLIDAVFETTNENLDESMATLKIQYAVPDLGAFAHISFELDQLTKSIIDKSDYVTELLANTTL